MTRGSRWTCAAALAIALSLLAARPALADDSEKARARALLVEGNQLLDDGDYAAALARFEQAYATYPSPALLLNIGTALRALDRHAEASNSYARWLRATRRPRHRAEVEEALAALDKLVGRVVLKINEPGASVSVGGAPVDKQIVGSVLRLEPGVHELVAQKDGFKPAVATVRLAAGEKRAVRLVLKRSLLPRPDEISEPDLADEDTDEDEMIEVASGSEDTVATSLEIAGFVAGGAGLISVAVGLKFGLDARRLGSEVDEAAAAGQLDVAAERTARGKSAENRFIAFTAVGGAAIIAGGVLYAMGHLRQRDREDRSIAVGPTVAPDLIGLAISGGF